MGIKQWIGRTFGLTESGFWSMWAGSSSAAGKTVTDHSALQLATVWACIRLNSEAVATAPIHVFEIDARGGRTRVDHPLQEVLDAPNSEMTGYEFQGAMAAWLLVRGNAFAEIDRTGGRITALNLIPADRMNVVRDQVTNDLRYRFTDRGQPVDLPAESVLHVRGFSFGSDLGLSPISFGAQSLGSAIAADETAGKMFGNGMMPSGVLKTPHELNPEQRQQLGQIMKQYAGSERAGKMMVVEGGLEFQALSLNPEDMQMLETRRFNVEEICRWFATPPVVIGHAAEGVTAWGTGIEALILQWLATGLNPLFRRFETRINGQLLSAADRRRVYAEYSREALLQTDSAAKIAFLSGAVQNALMTRNEARAKLNLPAKEGGDELTAGSNLTPLDQLGNGDPRADMRNALGINE